MIKKLCSYPGCHKVVEAGVKYCDKHRDTDRKKYREYKQQRMRDEEEARRQQFYNSKAWELFRAARAAEQLGIDIYEYYTTGRIVAADNYHHIQEITEAWARRLDAVNVIGLSEANHRRMVNAIVEIYDNQFTFNEANEEMKDVSQIIFNFALINANIIKRLGEQAEDAKKNLSSHA